MYSTGFSSKKESVPPRWKMALLRWIAGRNFPHVLAAGVVAGGIVVILYWIAMPLLMRVTRRWLYSEKKT